MGGEGQGGGKESGGGGEVGERRGGGGGGDGEGKVEGGESHLVAVSSLLPRTSRALSLHASRLASALSEVS